MGEFLDQIPHNVQGHIREITTTSGLLDSEKSVEKIAEGWLLKMITFDEEIIGMDLEEVEYFEKIDERGALAITYSGSLINIGPLNGDLRKVNYISIDLRKDVPDIFTNEKSTLANDIAKNEPIEFGAGPIRKTSPVFKVVVCSNNLTLDEQEERITETATDVMDEFVAVNKTLIK